VRALLLHPTTVTALQDYLLRDVRPRPAGMPVLLISSRGNASENDLRACVTKRRISGGTMSADGRQARDVMLGLMRTCRKLGISFFPYPAIASASNNRSGASPSFRTSSQFGPSEPDRPEICPAYPFPEAQASP